MRGLSSSYKLSKPKTQDNSDSSLPTSPTIQTSYDDLKKPQARQLLREQLSGAFPEAAGGRRSSEDLIRSPTMPLGHRFSRKSSNSLEVGNNASANTSSSTIDSVGPKRLSVVPEKDNQAIDVEQAINLLQELKKNASPEDLVALHRALLPTKDVETVTSPRASTFDERPVPSPAFQRRSALPPGLATRGGFAEDVLRKPGEELQKAKDQRNGWLQHSATSYSLPTVAMHNNSGSISSLAALDLADDGTYSAGRATTPSEWDEPRFGAYRPGTLRITNGAASPEPIINRIVNFEPAAVTETRQDDGYFTASEGRPSEEQTTQQIPSTRASIDVLPRPPSEESVRVRDKILNSDKARKQRASRLSGLSSTSKESLVSQLSQTQLKVTTSQSFESNSQRGSVSPVSDSPLPRWAQRQSHRASQISAEYVIDCELTASPYEDSNKNALQAFASRLSTVYDSDADHSEEQQGTPAAALSKLVGDDDENMPSNPRQEVAPHMDQTAPVPAPAPEQTYKGRPSPSKQDSGYASDVSFRHVQHRLSYERSTPLEPTVALMKTHLASELSLNQVDEQDETASLADTKSLYTFEEMLRSPDLLRDATTPSPAAKSKKSSPLLRLHTLKSEKRSSLSETAPQASSDSIPTIASTSSSPADGKKEHIAKQQRKLQKPMPAAVKKQRKEEYKKAKEAQKATSTAELPAIDTNVMAVHQQSLSDQPSSAHLDHTPIGVADKFAEDLQHSAPAELSGETTFPDHAANDDEAETPSRSRSKSVGRGRRTSDRQTAGDSSPEVGRSWSINKFRSKSGSRTRSKSRKRASSDFTSRKSLDTVRERDQGAVTPGEEILPAWTDFSSVARTLGSGSYDISTNQFKRATAPIPAATSHQLQSPYLISTGLSKAKSMKGMDSAAAAELARLKSRDISKQDLVPMNDRPRMAIPKWNKKGRSASGEAPLPTRSVEDRFPDWQSKPVSRETSPQRPQMSHRPHSMYAESIPPMPELPADAEVKALKADEMVAKKFNKDSARSTPAAFARNSAEAGPAQRKSAPVKRNGQSSKSPVTAPVENIKALELLHPVERAGVKQVERINVQVRELSGSGSDESSNASGDERKETVQIQQVQSPSHEAQHPGWPGWEEQAKAWRKRHESLGAALGKPADEASVIMADSPPMSRKTSAALAPSNGLSKSPSIVVSRYITPLAAESAARANVGQRPTDAASQQADAYRDSITDDKENRPAKQDVPRTDSAVTTTSTSTFVTVKSWDPRPAKQDVPRTGTGNSAISTNTYHSVTTTSTLSRSRSPGGHVRTPSGKFIPYSPSQASLAERSRAQSLAQLTGAAVAGTTSLGASTSSLETPAIRTKHGNSSAESLLNRYSGGLNYGWERGVGFAGSAGTRDSTGSDDGRRKSVKLGEEYGLDLSDVPVFLRRVR